MRIAYLDCSMGISGDMALGALVDCGVSPDAIRAAINSLGLDGVELNFETVIKGGFKATYATVTHPEQHTHRHLSDVKEIISKGDLTDAQRQLALRIFEAVARAEATVHGSTIDRVHFHEVGAIDSIVDIIGAAVGFDLLAVDRIECSRVPTGRGRISIDHGICTVPAPGTAELLKGIPLQSVPVDAELTTPTGAALLTVLVDHFGDLPEMTIEQIGYGSGTMDVPSRANLLRLFVGVAHSDPHTDRVTLLETNLDDATGETLGHAKRSLMEAGALDAYVTAIQMKKDRPGVTLSVLTRPEDADRLETMIFEETGTLGVRRHQLTRSLRDRQAAVVQTVYGPVTGKLCGRVGADAEFVPEYESCATVAQANGVPFRLVYRTAVAAGLGQASEAASGAKLAADHTHDHDHDHRHDHDHDHRHDHDHDHRHDHDHD